MDQEPEPASGPTLGDLGDMTLGDLGQFDIGGRGEPTDILVVNVVYIPGTITRKARVAVQWPPQLEEKEVKLLLLDVLRVIDND